jgi:hypothetical protein
VKEPAEGSRYRRSAVLEHVDAQGNLVRYREVRLVPDAPAVRSHLLGPVERLDHVAHRHFRDPTWFWALCDANLAMWPGDLEALKGSRILVPRREG